MGAFAPAPAGATIILHSGTYFDLQDPERAAFSIEDIAHALGNLCRFTGHTDRFYSVAEHSVLCSHMVPPEDALAALMHDAAEAFIGDVSSPLKALLPDYAAVERRVERAVWASVGLPDDLPASVKVADRMALALEQRFCMGNRDQWGDVPVLADAVASPIRFLSPAEARAAFLDRYQSLQAAAY